MRHVDLFSGIGGFALACEWAGVDTICFVEIDKFCQKILNKHWQGVPIIGDVNNVEEIKQAIEDSIESRIRRESEEITDEERGNSEDRGEGIRQGNGEVSASGIRTADKLLLTGGFPCQPFSNAGRKRGSSDDRYLWPQTLAVIEAVKPNWIILENVPGILNMVFPDSEVGVASQSTLFGVENDEICDYSTISGGIERDLRQAGYETVWLVIPACSLSAPHRRDRVWIVANSNSTGQQNRNGEYGGATTSVRERVYSVSGCNPVPEDIFAPNSDRAGNRTPTDGINGKGQEGNEGQIKQPQFGDSGQDSDVAQDAEDSLISGDGRRDNGNKARDKRSLQTARPNSDVTNTDNERLQRSEQRGTHESRYGACEPYEPTSKCDKDDTNPKTKRLARAITEGEISGGCSAEYNSIPGWEENWYEVATRVCTVDDGVSDGLVRPKGWRVNALKAAGNAIVPQVAHQLIKAIVEVDNTCNI